MQQSLPIVAHCFVVQSPLESMLASAVIRSDDDTDMAEKMSSYKLWIHFEAPSAQECWKNAAFAQLIPCDAR